MTVIDHPSRLLWLGAGAAGAVLGSDPRVTEVARRIVWERHRRQRLSAEAWGRLVIAEIHALTASNSRGCYAPGHNSRVLSGSDDDTAISSRLVVITSATLKEGA